MSLARYLFLPRDPERPQDGAEVLPGTSPAELLALTPAQRSALISALTPAQRSALDAAAGLSPARLDAVSLLHVADLELARAWLREALRLDAAAIDALDGRAQVDAVLGQWRAWGNYCSALNVRAHASARFRGACMEAWGELSGRSSALTFRARRGGRGPWITVGNGSWRTRVHRAWLDVTPQHQRRPWNFCAFGASQPAPLRASQYVDAMRSRAALFAPTGEVHRVWLSADNTLAGGEVVYPDEVPRLFEGRRADRWGDYVLRAVVGPCGSPGFGGCSETDDERGWDVYVLPAMRWYWELLRPVLEHARDVGPLAFVWECFLDTKAANLATLRAVLGRERVEEALVDDLAGEAERQAAQAIEDASAGTQEETAAFASAVGGVAGVLALFGPAGAAAGGVLAAGAAIGSAMVAALHAAVGVAEGAAYADPLGRLWPPYEVLRLADSVTLDGVRAVMPDPPAGWRPASDRPSPVALPAPSTTGPLRVPWAKLPDPDAPASLTVTSDVPGLRITVGGPGIGAAEEKLSVPWKADSLSPGTYRIRASAPGRASVTREVLLVGGAVYREHFAGTDLPLVTREAPAPPRQAPAPPRPSGGNLLNMGLALAALAVGWWLSERD